MSKRFAAFGLACALFRLSMGDAYGHSWYDKECCDIRDCEMMAEKWLPTEGDSYVLPNGERVPIANVRPSLDGDFHWCRYVGTTNVIRPSGQPICLYVPPGGV
jgi:hypothetical protein